VLLNKEADRTLSHSPTGDAIWNRFLSKTNKATLKLLLLFLR